MYQVINSENIVRKIVVGIVVFIEIILLLAVFSNSKAYAFNTSHPMTDPTPLIQARMAEMGYSGNYYYAILSLANRDGTTTYAFYASKEPDLLINVVSDVGVTAGDYIKLKSNNSGQNILKGESYGNKDTWSTSTNSELYFNYLPLEKKIKVIYSNCNIQYMDNDNHPTGSYLYLVHPVNEDYEYVYDTSIPNIDSMTIKKHSLYEIGGLVIGQSKSKYDVRWQAPSDASLQMELEVVSKYQSIAKRRRMQTPFETMYSGVILPTNELWAFDITSLGAYIKNKYWTDIDLGMTLSVPVTEMYFRYVRVVTDGYKIHYGNWTKLDFSGGPNGIIETVKNQVTTEVTVDENGNETYTDTVVEGTETEYINSQGEHVSEDESFSTAVDIFDNSIGSATNAIQSIGSWFGQVPQLVASVFIFIPPEIISFIGLSIVVLMILKIAGR